MADLLVLNPMTSASASLTRMEIYTTTHSTRCKPILPIRQLYKMTITGKVAAATAETTMTKVKATTIKKQQEGKKVIKKE